MVGKKVIILGLVCVHFLQWYNVNPWITFKNITTIQRNNDTVVNVCHMTVTWFTQVLLDVVAVRILIGTALIVQAGALMRYFSFFKQLNVRELVLLVYSYVISNLMVMHNLPFLSAQLLTPTEYIVNYVHSIGYWVTSHICTCIYYVVTVVPWVLWQILDAIFGAILVINEFLVEIWSFFFEAILQSFINN